MWISLWHLDVRQNRDDVFSLPLTMNTFIHTCMHKHTSTYSRLYTHARANEKEIPLTPVLWPAASTTSTGSTSNGFVQYSANMHTMVLSTTLALVRSVAVHSMNTSRVFKEICRRSQRKNQDGSPGTEKGVKEPAGARVIKTIPFSPSDFQT